METVFDYSELCFLLAKAGVRAPVGVDEAHFPSLKAAEKEDVLQAGQSKLKQRTDEHAQILVQVLAGPTAVIHATRLEENKPEEEVWFFYTPFQTVQMQKTEENQYQLAAVAEDTTVMDQIQQFLPLRPAPPELKYRVRIPREDFLTLRDLASEWNEVPALEILEADGLDQVASRELFDSAVEPGWRGIINCLTCQEQVVTGQTTIRALQGAEVSWVIRPSTGDHLIVETAGQGLFQQTLTTVWDTLLAGKMG